MSPPVNSVSTVSVNPPSISDLKSLNKTVTIAVDVSNSPTPIAFQSFLVILDYNTTMFSANSVDYSGNVLGSQAIIQSFCIDATQEAGSGTCNYQGVSLQSVGIITLGLYLQGNQSSLHPVSTGHLFNVTFSVKGSGFGQVHIFVANLVSTSLNTVPVVTQDGYYTNIDCPRGSGIACQAIKATILISPPVASVGAVVEFNASVVDPNRNAATVEYIWDFGDGTPTNSSFNPSLPMTHVYSIPLASTRINCAGGGTCTVTLIVVDNEGVSWSVSTTVLIQLINIHLTVHIQVAKNDQYNVLPGTLVRANATIYNESTIPENATYTLSLEGTVLNSMHVSLGVGGSAVMGMTWDTSGKVPRAYAVEASINESTIVAAQLANGKRITGENSTANNVDTAYILLISPLVNGAFSLSLLQTSGLGILILVAAGLGLARFLKKPSYETEPL